MQRNPLIHKIKRNRDPNSQRCVTEVWKMMRRAIKKKKKTTTVEVIRYNKGEKIRGVFIHLLFATFLSNPARSRGTACSVVISGRISFKWESHDTQWKELICDLKPLISAHFIILWPPRCRSQGGFWSSLRLKKIKSASHLNISVQNVSSSLYT